MGINEHMGLKQNTQRVRWWKVSKKGLLTPDKLGAEGRPL